MRGAGAQELALDRTASAAQWVIAPLGGVGPTSVSFGITVEGAYVAALGVAGGGLLLLVVAVELLRPRRSRRSRPSGTARPAAAPARHAGARRAGRRSRATALSVVVVLLAGGCQLPERSTEATATLSRTKVSLTAAELPALYASYDGRRARALRAAGPPGYRDGPWRAADRGAGAGGRPLRDGGTSGDAAGAGAPGGPHRPAGLRRPVRRLPDVGHGRGPDARR